MRRMSGRNPNFVLIGLTFVIFLMTYKCWTLSSQNDDLRKEIDKLQTELKISGGKQEQCEKEYHKLKGNIHDLDEKQLKLKLQVDEEDQQIQDAQNILKLKENEIATLKNNLIKKEESEKDLIQTIEEKDNKIEELISDSQHILTLKNDAEEALSEKDSYINNLKRELEQLRKEFEQKSKEELVSPNHSIIQGPFNLPNAESKEPYLAHGALGYVPKHAVRTRAIGLQGLKFHPGSQILPRQSSDVNRGRPRYSIADVAKVVKEKNSKSPYQIQEPDSKANLADQIKKGAVIGNNGDQPSNVLQNPPLDNNKQEIKEDRVSDVLEKPSNKQPIPGEEPQLPEQVNPVLQEPNMRNIENHSPVLQEPYMPPQVHHRSKMALQPQKAEALGKAVHYQDRNKRGKENLDTAIDEEAKVVDDPSDDQDEEGKEIKRDLENNAADNYENYDDDKVDNPHLIKEDNVEEEEEDPRHEPKGIGAMEIPRHQDDVKGAAVDDAHDDVNLVDDVDHRANERFYEANFDSKIRNLGGNNL